MLKKISTQFLITFLLTSSLFAENWALEDKALGWNTRELVTLYFHNSELQTQWAWEALSNYRITGNENVLDFGAGDGKISALMSFMVPDGRVTGIDLSEKMVAYATKLFPFPYYKNLTFCLSPDVDFAKVDFPKKFDLVTSFCVFHLIPNPTTVLANIREWMTPQCTFVATLPIGGNKEFFQAVSDEMVQRGWDFPSSTTESRLMRNPEKIQEIFANAGYEVTHFKVIPTRFPYNSKEELINWCEGTLTANWNIPHQERKDFFAAIVDRYLSYRPDEKDNDGFVYFSLNRVDIAATPKAAN